MIEFSIVIPCLNEENTLPQVIKKSQRTFKRLKIVGEILIIDNGSTDGSKKIAKQSGARVLVCKKKGYGNALIYGFSKARGHYLIMGDADDSYNFEEIDGFVTNLRKGYDFVMGSRLKGHIKKGAMPWLHRYIGTPFLTFLINLLFKTGITDSNCGLRGLSKSAFKKLHLSSTGMEFASEMVINAGIYNLKRKEIPVTLYCDKRIRPSHLHTWRDGIRNLKLIAKSVFIKKIYNSPIRTT